MVAVCRLRYECIVITPYRQRLGQHGHRLAMLLLYRCYLFKEVQGYVELGTSPTRERIVCLV